MGELRPQLDLAAEPADSVCIRHFVRADDLDGDDSASETRPGLVDGPIAALAQLVEQDVRPDCEFFRIALENFVTLKMTQPASTDEFTSQGMNVGKARQDLHVEFI